MTVVPGGIACAAHTRHRLPCPHRIARLQPAARCNASGARARRGRRPARSPHISHIPSTAFPPPSSARVTVPLNGATISAPFLAAISIPRRYLPTERETNVYSGTGHTPVVPASRSFINSCVRRKPGSRVAAASGCRACVPGRCIARGRKLLHGVRQHAVSLPAPNGSGCRWQRRCFPAGQPPRPLSPCRRAAPKARCNGHTCAVSPRAVVPAAHIGRNSNLPPLPTPYRPKTATRFPHSLPRADVYSTVARTELCADVFILRHGPDRRPRRLKRQYAFGRFRRAAFRRSGARIFKASSPVPAGSAVCGFGELPLTRSAAPSAAHAVRPAAGLGRRRAAAPRP